MNRQRVVGWLLTLSFALAIPGLASAAPDKKTERLWKSKCASCHGADGKGDTDQGKEMGIGDVTTAAWQKQFTDQQIKDVVAKGFKREKNGKQQEMKPLADLTPEQVDALVGYVRSLKK